MIIWVGKVRSRGFGGDLIHLPSLSHGKSRGKRVLQNHAVSPALRDAANGIASSNSGGSGGIGCANSDLEKSQRNE
jgi:hypothetical protein